MEDPSVFDEVHRFILELVARGAADRAARRPRGRPVRARRLPAAPAGAHQRRGSDAQRTRVLHRRRKDSRRRRELPADWPVYGTTGYEFAARREQPVRGRPQRASVRRDLRAVRYAAARARRRSTTWRTRARSRSLHETMSGDINSLGHQLNRFSERNRHFRDFTLYSLISTIKEVIACFPVYRTYITAEARSRRHDRRYIAEAVRCAKRRAPGVAVARVRLHRAAAAEADARRQPEECAERGAVHRQVPADHEPGRREGHRGHGALRLQPAALVERGRRAIRRGSASSPTAVHALDGRAAAPLAGGALDHVDARHQARRGRARAAERRSRKCRARGRRRSRRWRALEPPLQDRRRRRRRRPTRTRSICSTRRSSAPGRSTRATSQPASQQRLERYMIKALREAKVAHELAEPGRRVRGGGAPLRRRDPRSAEPAVPARLPSVSGAHRRARHLQQPRAAADQDYGARRAGFLSGHRAVGPLSRRSRQPAVRSTTRVASRCSRTSPTRSPALLLDERADGRVKMFVMNRALGQRATLRDTFDAAATFPLWVTGRTATTCSRSPGATGGNRRRSPACRALSEACSAAGRPRRSGRPSGETRASCSRRRARRPAPPRFATP